MTATESSERADAIAAPERRRLYRAAGLGGIGAFVAWLGQPIVVAVFSPLAPENGPDFDYIASTPFNGVIEAALFSAIGVGLLFLVTATGSLVRPTSAAARVGQTMGIVGASVWLLVAGGSLALYSSVGWGLGDVATDPALQQALYQTLGIVTTGHLLAYAIGMAGWLLMLATAGRRAGAVGWPLSIVALAAAAAMAVSQLFPFAPPWGSLAAIGMGLVLGIAFLVKARRVR